MRDILGRDGRRRGDGDGEQLPVETHASFYGFTL